MTGDPADFEPFFRYSYRPLLRDLLSIGARREEAEDALSAAMEYALKHWSRIDSPYAYVQKAALRQLIRNRQRDERRIQRRLVAWGVVGRGTEPAPGQVIWEQQQFVKDLLASLAPAQRAVMACVVDTLTPTEIAQLMGKNPDAIRQCLLAARRRLQKDLAESYGVKRRPADGEEIR